MHHSESSALLKQVCFESGCGIKCVTQCHVLRYSINCVIMNFITKLNFVTECWLSIHRYNFVIMHQKFSRTKETKYKIEFFVQFRGKVAMVAILLQYNGNESPK